MDSAKNVLKDSADNIDKLKESLENLTKVSNEIFTKLYQNNAQNPNGDPNQNTDPSGNQQ